MGIRCGNLVVAHDFCPLVHRYLSTSAQDSPAR
jgi:hypothetical protein